MAQPPNNTSASLDPDRALAGVANKSRALPALQVGARYFTLGDILDAAEWRGDLAGFRLNWIVRHARANAAAKMELEPAPEEVESAVNEFRYARDLVSAEECERWLDQRGLEFTHLTTCVSRRLQAALADADAPAELAASDQEIFCIEAILSDEFTLWAHRLASRLALGLDAGMTFPEGGVVALLPAMEERLQAAVAGWTTPDRQRRALANQRLGLTQITVEASEFDSAPAAREARLCTVVDGVSLAETATANGFACQQVEGFLDKLPENWRPGLLSARSGDIVAPRGDEDRFPLLHVLRRREPSLDDEGVLGRLNDGLVLQRLQELETRHIRWAIALEVDA
jgi:hypothetical protein